jgi:tetratricopeptide (TPR) repeat protein
VHIPDAATFYQALALQKLGQGDKAKASFESLIANAKAALNATPAPDSQVNTATSTAGRARIADAHFLAGLGEVGLGNKQQAWEEFNIALKASPDHVAAKKALDNLK